MAAYARREGVDVEAFVRQMGPPVPPGQVGRHIAELASSTDHVPGAYLVTPGGLAPAPGTPAP